LALLPSLAEAYPRVSHDRSIFSESREQADSPRARRAGRASAQGGDSRRRTLLTNVEPSSDIGTPACDLLLPARQANASRPSIISALVSEIIASNAPGLGHSSVAYDEHVLGRAPVARTGGVDAADQLFEVGDNLATTSASSVRRGGRFRR
jgi:hypothetical protein